MNKNWTLICATLCALVFTGCKKDDVQPVETKQQTIRTVLAYMLHDTNLWWDLTQNINDMERAWDPSTNGTLLVYVDASTKMTQFGGKPVLLEIEHDTTQYIVSRVVKVYEDADPTNADVFRGVQQDAIEMYPAQSYGLIISGHGDAFVTRRPSPKGMSGADRFGGNYLDVDVIADNLPVHYDFLILDACLMGEATTLYQLRNGADFVVASTEISPGAGFAYRSHLRALFTQPKADLGIFAEASRDFYKTEQGQLELDNGYSTIAVYRMSAMDQLAATTKKVIEKINLTYYELKFAMQDLLNDERHKFPTSMYYPADMRYQQASPRFFDMRLLAMYLENMDEEELYYELFIALTNVVIQHYVAVTPAFQAANPDYRGNAICLSFFIPTVNPGYEYLDEVFYNRFGWAAASGFTSKWK